MGLSLVYKFNNTINLMVLDFFPVDLSLEVMNSGQLAKNDWHPGETETKEIPLCHHIFPALPLPQTRWVPAGIVGWQWQWVICLGDWGTLGPAITALGLNVVAAGCSCINSMYSTDFLNSLLLKRRTHKSLSNCWRTNSKERQVRLELMKEP